jgi:hypothetical protein
MEFTRKKIVGVYLSTDLLVPKPEFLARKYVVKPTMN